MLLVRLSSDARFKLTVSCWLGFSYSIYVEFYCMSLWTCLCVASTDSVNNTDRAEWTWNSPSVACHPFLRIGTNYVLPKKKALKLQVINTLIVFLQWNIIEMIYLYEIIWFINIFFTTLTTKDKLKAFNI